MTYEDTVTKTNKLHHKSASRKKVSCLSKSKNWMPFSVLAKYIQTNKTYVRKK